MKKSPIFDGSATSLSGNGEYIANKGDIVLGGGGLPYLSLPAGSGGGCVITGPFANMTVNLGPVALWVSPCLFFFLSPLGWTIPKSEKEGMLMNC